MTAMHSFMLCCRTFPTVAVMECVRMNEHGLQLIAIFAKVVALVLELQLREMRVSSSKQ